MTHSERAPKKVLLSWSTGKDSAWTLHRLRQDAQLEVCGLLTTVNEEFERVAMHGVREILLETQARAVGLPLQRVAIPSPCPNEEYEARFIAAARAAKARGIEAIAYGDLYLEDIRAYRERLMDAAGMEALFPLWGLETKALAEAMLHEGTRAILTCIDPKVMPPDFAGRTFDEELLAELPDGIDPCGENGEFHTFAFAGPAFSREIRVQPGIVVERGGFLFADLLPEE